VQMQELLDKCKQKYLLDILEDPSLQHRYLEEIINVVF